ncbi:MAG: response regulator [Candidatus Hydrogenedentota bacterium]
MTTSDPEVMPVVSVQEPVAAKAPPAVSAHSDIAADFREWYRSRLESKREIMEQQPAQCEGEEILNPALMREAHHIATAAHLFGFEKLSSLAVALQGSELATMPQALDALMREIQELLAARIKARGSILLLDGDAERRGNFGRALRCLRADIVEVDSAGEAEDFLGKQTVHLILMALPLPDGDGREFIRQLTHRQHTSSISILVMANVQDEPTGEDTLMHGAESFFRLPIETNTFARVVETRLDGAMRRRSLDRSDRLTDLPTRVVFCEALDRAVSFAHRTSRPLSVALISLDGAAEIAAHHGRRIKDDVTQRCAEAIRRTFRSSDLLAYWGSGCFASFFPNTTSGHARRAIEKAQDSIRRLNITGLDGRPLTLRISAGIADITRETMPDTAVAHALWYLKHAQEDPANPIAVQPSATGEYRQSVLIAETDASTREVVAHRFRREDWEVTECHDGRAAIEAVLSGGPAHTFLIIDAHLPRINGLDLIRRLREMGIHSTTPILLLAVEDSGGGIAQALSLGANDYMTKPFSPLELMTRVRRLVRPR